MGRTDVYFIGNSMLIKLVDLTDESDDTTVTAGVTVEAEIFDEDGNSVQTVSMSHQSDGLWIGTSSVDTVDPTITVGDEIKVVYTVDGGTPESQAKWTARPTVRERAA